jgi:thioredoxin-like negative regulator of GroEL
MMDKYQNSSDVSVEEINCAQNPEAGDQYKIKAFPTVLKIKDDQVTEYEGDRTAEDVDNFIKN